MSVSTSSLRAAGGDRAARFPHQNNVDNHRDGREIRLTHNSPASATYA